MILVLLGPPGVGKGTQAGRIALHYEIPTISTGAMFRDAVTRGTELGRIIQRYRIEKGEYVPDEVVITAVKLRTAEPDCTPGFLMDGFPRTIPQADALEALLLERGRKITGALELKAPIEEIVGRFSGRRVCPLDGSSYHLVTQPPLQAGLCDICHTQLVRRDDDDPEVVQRRLEVYMEKTTPLMDYYRERGMLLTVDATAEPETVFGRILEALDAGRPRPVHRLEARNYDLFEKAEEIEKIRAAGRVINLVMKAAEAAIAPGITTGALEDLAVSIIAGEWRDFALCWLCSCGHPPYPAWTCISTNEEIVHGIPGRRVLKEGDVVTVDCVVELNGWIADSAWTFLSEKFRPAVERLLKVTEESLYKGIEQAKAGNRTGDIGYAVQKFVEAHGYSVVRELSGHGVGRSLHEDPQVYNYGSRGKGELLQCGMTFAIEPMVNSGRKETKVLTDRWTIATADRKYSAHFEHTVAITPEGATILTNGD